MSGSMSFAVLSKNGNLENGVKKVARLNPLSDPSYRRDSNRLRLMCSVASFPLKAISRSEPSLYVAVWPWKDSTSTNKPTTTQLFELNSSVSLQEEMTTKSTLWVWSDKC